MQEKISHTPGERLRLQPAKAAGIEERKGGKFEIRNQKFEKGNSRMARSREHEIQEARIRCALRAPNASNLTVFIEEKMDG